ncbi:MAG: zinc-ribbon domain-containing protein [Proteobacteria bacterium]|nr:zinc-ribbon domain-containing protein [Pseudomonadota bacterium]
MWEYGAMLGILAVTGYWVFRPLFRPEPLESVSPKKKENQEQILQRRKEEVYEAIKEMDIDYGMGKISKDDYQELTSQYKAKAIQIVRELDAVEGEDDIDRAIEREVQQLRKEGRPKEKKRNGKGAVWNINFCPQCGRKVDPNDNFCQDCGMTLAYPTGRE